MIRFFCLVYGERYLDMLERVAVRSLLQSDNRRALHHQANTQVALYTDVASADRAVALLSRLAHVELNIMPRVDNAGEMLRRAMTAEIAACLMRDATMITLGPDWFWGDGSLHHLQTLVRGADACIAAPHPRVDHDRFLAALPDGDIDNRQLVGLALETLHCTWRDARVPADMANCWKTGIAIQSLGRGLYAVHHLLPSIWLAHFRPSDLDFFAHHDKCGVWDHYWPAKLVEEGRQIVVADSDIVFLVELTHPDENRPQLRSVDQRDPFRYRGDLAHHRANRAIVSGWRSR